MYSCFVDVCMCANDFEIRFGSFDSVCEVVKSIYKSLSVYTLDVREHIAYVS